MTTERLNTLLALAREQTSPCTKCGAAPAYLRGTSLLELFDELERMVIENEKLRIELHSLKAAVAIAAAASLDAAKLTVDKDASSR